MAFDPTEQDSSSPYSILPGDPSIRDVLDIHTREILLDFNCHAIATVTAFNPMTTTPGGTVNIATVDAQMVYTQTQMVENAAGQLVPQQQSYPVLLSCPAIILGGGGTALTFPIKPGDQCLILFNDRDLSGWFSTSGGAVGEPPSERMHSFSDGIALIGLNPIQSYDTDNVTLDGGSALLALKNEVTSLKTILLNLISAINGMTVSPGSFNAAGTPVTGSGSVSGVASIESQVEDLLA